MMGFAWLLSSASHLLILSLGACRWLVRAVTGGGAKSRSRSFKTDGMRRSGDPTNQIRVNGQTLLVLTWEGSYVWIRGETIDGGHAPAGSGPDSDGNEDYPHDGSFDD